MEFDLFNRATGLSFGVLEQKIPDTNEESAEYGLALSKKDIEMLMQSNRENLQLQERIEISESIVPKLIRKFMRSRYISQMDYADTLATLLDIFYESKEESNDMLTDDEVVDLMFYYFENISEGSAELLQTRDMEVLCRKLRNGETILSDNKGDD